MDKCPFCEASWAHTNYCAHCGRDLRRYLYTESKTARAPISSELDLFRVEKLASGKYKLLGLALRPDIAVEHIRIPDCVETIGSDAFAEDPRIKSVEIGDGVTVIETKAFHGCANLSAVAFGSGVQVIGSAAFAHCTALTRLSIPESVEKIGDGAFMACSGLVELSIGKGVAAIGSLAFLACNGLDGREICLPTKTVCKWMSFSDQVRIKRVDG